MDVLNDFRLEKDDFFANSAHSPLTTAQKKVFQGLSYFPENPLLRVETTLVPFEKQDKVQIQTTTGALQVFNRLGRIKFSVDGQETELTIFSDKNGYFLPFVDALAGSETYAAGRYLEPELVGDKKLGWISTWLITLIAFTTKAGRARSLRMRIEYQCRSEPEKNCPWVPGLTLIKP